MSTSLKEFGKMNATGIGSQDVESAEGGLDREGILGQRPPTSIVATGRKDSSIRRGMSLNERTEGKR